MIWYIVLGISTGMRTLTATAVLCWFAWLQLLPQHGWSSWTGNIACAIVFTVMALGEYYGDTLPSTPNRTAIGPLLARVAFGAFVGALSAQGIDQPLAGGILFALAGVFIGAFGGIRLRLWVTGLLRRPVLCGVLESALALALAITAALMLHFDMMGTG